MDDRRTRRSALPSVWPYPRSNGSITTFAWNGDVDWTSMMRGFNRTLLCMRDPQVNLEPASRELLRIQLDHQAFVDVLPEFRAVRRALERAGHLLDIDLAPRRKTDLLGELERVLDAELLLRLLGRRDDVPGPHQRRRNVADLAVDRDRAVADDLPRLG